MIGYCIKAEKKSIKAIIRGDAGPITSAVIDQISRTLIP